MRTIATRQAARLLHDGAIAFSEMEHNGVRVDVPYLEEQIEKVGERIRKKTARLRKDKVYETWRKRFGDKSNLGSKSQLATVVFDCLGYPRQKVAAKKIRNDSGDSGYRESKQNEEAFQNVDLPFVKHYFITEKLKRLKSTYLEGIHRECANGFVHPSYNLHTVVSYRSSCSTPNFQNLPARNPAIAELLRRCYIPRAGRQLVENDYSGIEVRIACCYTKDQQLIKEFTGPDGDPHGDTAKELFLMKGWKPANAEEARAFKKGPRDWAKNRFVFPEFYGQVYFECAKLLWKAIESGSMHPDGTKTAKEHLRENGIHSLGDCEANAPIREGTFVGLVKKVEDGFWNRRFQVYAAWKKRWYSHYLRDGGFDLFTGFHIEGLFDRNAVLNLAIQGTAFHCELWSIIQLIKAIRKYKMKSLIIGQIHDCDITDVVPRELQDYLDLQTEIKEVRLRKEFPWLIVPMTTEAEVCGVDEPWTKKAVWTKRDDTWSLKS